LARAKPYALYLLAALSASFCDELPRHSIYRELDTLPDIGVAPVSSTLPVRKCSATCDAFIRTWQDSEPVSRQLRNFFQKHRNLRRDFASRCQKPVCPARSACHPVSQEVLSHAPCIPLRRFFVYICETAELSGNRCLQNRRTRMQQNLRFVPDFILMARAACNAPACVHRRRIYHV
jgi:hypothetical protein